MWSRIFRTLKDEEVCFDLLDIIGKKPCCIYEKTTANSRVCITIGFHNHGCWRNTLLAGPLRNQPTICDVASQKWTWPLESLERISRPNHLFFSVNIPSRFKPKAHWKTKNSQPCLNTHQKRAWFATDKSRQIIVKHFKSKSLVTSIMPNYRCVGLIWSITYMAEFLFTKLEFP